jgi:electron transfer flavoprotein alpha subunit
VLAIVAAAPDGQLTPAARAVLRAAALIANAEQIGAAASVLTSPSEDVQRRAITEVLEQAPLSLALWPVERPGPIEIRSRLLQECWPALGSEPRLVIGEAWAEDAFAMLSRHRKDRQLAALRVQRLTVEDGHLVVETSALGGKLRARQTLPEAGDGTGWITLMADAAVESPASGTGVTPRVERWTPHVERLYSERNIQLLLDEVKEQLQLPRLTDADFIIDVGFGVANRDNYEAIIKPLERLLHQLGVKSLAIGGSRKVTEELHLLPVDRQIGQSGVSVNPRLILAIGVSGAPQHLNYIGPRATILAFNRDPEAPIMTLNQRQPHPRVFPVLGDLMETVPAFMKALGNDAAAASRQPESQMAVVSEA